MLVLAAVVSSATAVHPDPAGSGVVREYCTDAGPVTLRFDGSAVRGTFSITVHPPAKGGTLEGTIEGGLLDAKWEGPNEPGRLVFAFYEDLSRFTGVYTHRSRATRWDGPWMGVLKSKAEEQKMKEGSFTLRCD
jgi:hypothetical protein